MSKYLLSFFFFVTLPSQAVTLTYVGETSIETGTKFENTTIGGLSGMTMREGKLLAVSDDKGKVNDVRFYEFDLKIERNRVSLIPRKVRFITNIRHKETLKRPLDLEGMALVNGSELVISSEGNNDSKPRVMPRIFKITRSGEWIQDFELPAHYLPETTGLQTQGVQNNSSLEGLTITEDSQYLFSSLESALQGDAMPDAEDKGDFIRILRFPLASATPFVADFEYVYQVDAFDNSSLKKEVFRGVSEILAISKTKLLVLERGVRINPANVWTHTAGIYEVDLSQGTNVLKMSTLKKQKFQVVSKKKILNFEVDLKKERGSKPVQNLEALAFGPRLKDGRRTLMVMSDNNFSKKERTELLVFALDGE